MRAKNMTGRWIKRPDCLDREFDGEITHTIIGRHGLWIVLYHTQNRLPAEFATKREAKLWVQRQEI